MKAHKELMMKTFTLRNFESMVEVAVSCFTGTSGVEEYHILSIPWFRQVSRYSLSE